VRRKCFANFGHYDGTVALFSITPPGQDRLPWDEAICTHDVGTACSGKLGCRVERTAARSWNLRAKTQWRDLHRKASQNVRRRCKGLQILGRVWEFQARGVLHVHVVVGLEKPINRHAAALYLAELERLHQAHDFGWPDRKYSSFKGENAAAYVSSYFISGKGKGTIRETVQHEDVPPHVLHVSTNLTRATGCTMRSLRRRRFAWVCVQRGQAIAVDGDVIDVATGELLHRDVMRL
jgi:hypothetical protein